jgi:hypothetical protein
MATREERRAEMLARVQMLQHSLVYAINCGLMGETETNYVNFKLDELNKQVLDSLDRRAI